LCLLEIRSTGDRDRDVRITSKKNDSAAPANRWLGTARTVAVRKRL